MYNTFEIVTWKISAIILSMVVLSCCIMNDNNLGRGYRYGHGGNYYGVTPSISTDGKKIVFGSVRYGLGDICIVDIDGANYQRLTFTASYEGEPKFSTDGKKIVFVSERDDNNTGHIYIMNNDGTNQQQITKSKYYDSCPSFSPKGDKIIFNREIENNNYEIFLINVDGTNEKRLTFNKGQETYPRFSSNGNRIVFLDGQNSDVSEVWSMNIDGSQKICIIKMMKKCGSPSFSSDGNKIVFINAMEINYQDETKSRVEIWTMNRDGSVQKQITFTKNYKSYPFFTPDDKQIIFFEPEKDGQGRGQIKIVNIDGGNLRTIANNY